MSVAVVSNEPLAEGPRTSWRRIVSVLTSESTRRVLRQVRTVVVAAAAALIGVLFLAVTVVPQSHAYATFVVLTQSMEPTIHQGSVVVVSEVPTDQVHVGDIITFTSSLPPYSTLTHRVMAIEQGDNGLAFQTKGDANLLVDPWKVSYAGQAGLVRLAIPVIGYVLAAISTAFGRTALGLLLAAMVAGFMVLTLWLKPARKADDNAAPPAASEAPAPESES